MDNNLRNLCEQIQEDIITFAESSSSVGITCTDLNNLCEVVVRNFSNFDSGNTNVAPREQSFITTEIEFDVSGFEEELQAGLQKEWRGQITEPLLEEEIANYISDRSGWCVRHVEYSTLSPAS